jgi:superfamily II DNA helicase RecQ
MKYQFFTIPVQGSHAAAAELNQFLAEKRVIAVEREFIADGCNSAWSFCICYDDTGDHPTPSKTAKVDYKEILSAEDFAVFAKLRLLRKQLAEQEGVPAYALFTNQQLADMVVNRVTTLAALRKLPGVGESRVEKYGRVFLEMLANTWQAASAQGAGEDHEN